MKDRSGEEKGKRRKEGEIIKRDNDKDWIEAGGRERRNCGGYVVR